MSKLLLLVLYPLPMKVGNMFCICRKIVHTIFVSAPYLWKCWAVFKKISLHKCLPNLGNMLQQDSGSQLQGHGHIWPSNIRNGSIFWICFISLKLICLHWIPSHNCSPHWADMSQARHRSVFPKWRSCVAVWEIHAICCVCSNSLKPISLIEITSCKCSPYLGNMSQTSPRSVPLQSRLPLSGRVRYRCNIFCPLHIFEADWSDFQST